MNALDRLRRSVQRLPSLMGEVVTVNGVACPGLFNELDADSDMAFDVLRADPMRRATVEIAEPDAVARSLVVRAGVVVHGGEEWKIVPPRRRAGGFIVISLERKP